MLLVIHNLNNNVKYAEIKALIQSKCGLTDFVLDNLMSEGNTKRVTVGLADEGDAAFLVRKINGLYLNGQHLYVEDVRQPRASEQPYRPKPKPIDDYQPTNYQSSNYQRDLPRNSSIQENNSNLGYQDSSALGYQDNTSMMNQAAMMNYNNMAMGMTGMYYQPQVMSIPQATGYLGYVDQSQQMAGMVQLPKTQQSQSFGYGGQGGMNRGSNWDDNRLDNNRPMMRGSNRSPSPVRGIRSNSFNAPAPRWEPPKPVPPPEAIRRSRTPPRGNWDNNTTSVASFASYYDNPKPTGRVEPQNYGQQRAVRSNFADPTQAANVFGDHVIKNQQFNEPKPWNEPNSFQRGGRENAREPPRGGNFATANKGPASFGGRNRFEGPDPTTSWRNQPKAAPKRFAERQQFDGPPQKKFAQPGPRQDGPKNFKGNAPRFESKGPRQDGANTKNWKDNAPRFQGASKFEKAPPVTMTKMLNKDDTWRGQAAANLAKEMADNLGLDLSVFVVTRLKRSIRSRINLLLGSTISDNRFEIEKRYRSEFPKSGDLDFVQAVVETAKTEQAAAIAAKAEDPSGENAEKPESAPKPVKPKPVKTPQAPTPKKPVAQFKPKLDPTGKLPKYPNADKKAVHRNKVEERHIKGEIEKELSPELQKALEEEVDVLSDLFMSECMDPSCTNPQEKKVCEEIADVVSDEFRKVVRLHVTKRLLNLTTNLAVRAISQGKIIPRDLLEAFVKDYGATALKKSDKGGKLYLVHVDTFENYDSLNTLGEVCIGGYNVNFKPLHVLGAPPTAKEVREQMLMRNKRFLEAQIDKSGENLLKPGYSITPTVDSVAAQAGNTEIQQTGDQVQETGDEIQETGDQSAEVFDLTNDDDDEETENPQTDEANVAVNDEEQEGEVYDIEAEEETVNEEDGGDCGEDDVVECEDVENAGEHVDEDDLSDY